MRKNLLFTGAETGSRAINWSFNLGIVLLLAPKEYGILAVLISIESMMSVLFLGGFDRSAIRFVSDKSEQVSSSKILIIWFGFAVLALTAILFGTWLWPWTERYYIPAEQFWLVLAAIFMLSYSRVVASISRAVSDSTSFMFLRLGFPCVKVLLFLAIFFVTRDVFKSYFFSLSIALMTVLIPLSYKYLKSKNTESISKPIVKKIVSYALPFLPHSIFGIVLASIDRLMINDIQNAEEAGLYNFAYTIGAGLSFVYAIVAVNYERDLFSKAQDKRYVERSQNRYFETLNQLGYWAIVLVGLLYFLLPQFAPSYHSPRTLEVSMLILLGYILNIHYLQASYYLAIEKKSVAIASMTFLAMALNVGLNYILIPKYGMVGAAWATLFTYILLSIAMSVMAKTKTDFKVFCMQKWIFTVLSIVATIIFIFEPAAILVVALLVVSVYMKSTVRNLKVLLMGV